MAVVGLFLGTGCTAAVSVPPTTTDAADPAAVFAGVEEFWRDAYPRAFGAEYTELRGSIHQLDSTAASGGALCIGSPAQITGNAYYCADSDGIVYDTGVLVPVLLAHYGDAGLHAGFAHEFGHAVAARVGVPEPPAVLKELQADCFAGNYLAATIPDQLVPALAPLLDFADQPSVRTTDQTAHGLAVDRAQAVQLGVRGGPTACRDLAAGSLKLTLGTVNPGIDARKELLAAAAATWQASARATPTTAGCELGRSVAATFPDEALNHLRAQPDVTVEVLFAFLDGYAGRSC